MFQPSSNVNQKTSIVHFYLANKADIIYRFSKDYYVKIRLSHKDKKFLVVFVKKKNPQIECSRFSHLSLMSTLTHVGSFGSCSPFSVTVICGDGNGRGLTIDVRSQNVILEL